METEKLQLEKILLIDFSMSIHGRENARFVGNTKVRREHSHWSHRKVPYGPCCPICAWESLGGGECTPEANSSSGESPEE